MNRPGPQPADLPANLESGFRVRDARLAGLSRNRLRSKDLDAPFWGLRSTESVLNTRDRCALLSKRMPANAFFSHATAALLHGMPLPLRLQHSKRLDVGVPAPHRAPHADGIIGHRLTIAEYDLTDADGIRSTTAARPWCDLGSVLSLLDLVAAGDFVINHRAPLASVTDILEVANLRVSPRGRATIFAAIPLLNARSESPPESVLRVLLKWAGLPAPSVNHDFVDGNVNLIARTDLYIEPYNLVIEYQGDYHRTEKERWRADMTRRGKLEADGRRYMELNADDLKDPKELVARIRKRTGLPS